MHPREIPAPFWQDFQSRFGDIEPAVGDAGRVWWDQRTPFVNLGEAVAGAPLFWDGGWTEAPAPIQVIEPKKAEHGGGLLGLVQVVDRLLGPGGCPWDIAQTHDSLKKYLLEEAYETIEAIESGSKEALHEELGDLLLQPLMHTQIRQRDGDWGIQSVAEGIAEKLVRRHPHVFGDVAVEDADEVLRNWDQIKQQEKQRSILAGVPKGMASLLRAHEISKRAARVGFEWPDLEDVFAKLEEERIELREAIVGGEIRHIESELGDLLFTVVNIARWLKIDAEEALRRMLDRFTSRFQAMEEASPKPLGELSAQEWDDLWNAAKLTSS